MPLTELQIRAAMPRDTLFKLSDGGGLQLGVHPDGAKRWRMGPIVSAALKRLWRSAFILRRASPRRVTRGKKRSGLSSLVTIPASPGSSPRPRNSQPEPTHSTRSPMSCLKRSAARRRRNERSQSSDDFSVSRALPLARVRSLRSRLPKSWRSCGWSSHGAGSKPPAGFARPSAKCSASPSPQAAPRAILRGRSRAQSLRPS